MRPEATENAQATWSRDAFGLVQMLARELSEGRVQLPGFPEVVLRVQRVLTDERAGLEQIAQAISTEPMLAMQVMRMANSAAFNTTAQQVTDVRAAVNRLGNRVLRAAALAFAVDQLRNSEDLRPLRDRLNSMWRRGVVVGAVARALAMQNKAVSPDAALLVGLLHVVGRLYILARINTSPQLFEEPGAVERIMDQWGGNIGKALLENWEMPEEFCEAVSSFDDPDRTLRGVVGLADVLSGAHILADLVPPSRTEYLDQIQLATVYAHTESLWQRMRLTREQCNDALHAALTDVQHLRAQFGA